MKIPVYLVLTERKCRMLYHMAKLEHVADLGLSLADYEIFVRLVIAHMLEVC